MHNATTTARWYTLGGLVLLGVLLLAVNAVAERLLGGLRLDLTSNDLYTLSDGTRDVLADIEEPVNLYYFYSEDTARAIPQIASHARRVRELLDEFAAVAKGKLRVTVIDPEPFSDEEDRAVALGVEPVPLNDAGRSLYFGIAGTNSVGDQQAIRYFQLNRATLLEYDLAKLVYQLAHPSKPVVGLLSQLPMSGGFDQRFMQQTPAWFVRERIGEVFEVREIAADATRIEDDVDVLAVVHPASLGEPTLYAIDQYVMRGGRLIAFVDPYSEAGGNPGAAGSTLEPLFGAWGIDYDPTVVAGDAEQAIAVSVGRNQPPVYHLAMIGVGQDRISPDDVITRGLGSVNLGHAGFFAPAAGDGEGPAIEFTPLLTTSERAGPIEAGRLRGLADPGTLQRDFKPGGKPLVLAARVSGTFASAFADGAPEGADQTQEHRATGEPNNLVVVGDTDMLSDRFWVQVQNLLGQRLAIPFANNADFVINALDNLLGSNALINIRGRADFSRPFHRVDLLRREADAKFRLKEQELQDKLRETERKLSELQGQDGGGGQELLLSAEQQQALLGFQEEKLRIRKQLRDVQHQLNRDIEALGTTLKFVNIALVPLVLSAIVLVLAIARRRTPVAGKGAPT